MELNPMRGTKLLHMGILYKCATQRLLYGCYLSQAHNNFAY
jgi:hypothetical protein